MATRNCERCPVGGKFDSETYVCSEPDPDDGLPVTCVGEWAEDKHKRVRRYVDISRPVRAKFANKAGASFIDIFSGPGRSRIKYSTRLIDGSAVAAAKAASDPKSCFSCIHIGDTNPEFLEASEVRLTKFCDRVCKYEGPAEDTVISVCSSLGRGALNVAFLDPYDLASLPFAIIERLGREDRMDVIIHVSLHDLQRNIERYFGSSNSPLDQFSPGWRSHVDPTRQTKAEMRRAVLDYWKGRIRSAKLTVAEGVEKITGSTNQNLYWLVFAAGHPLANKFWEEIRDIHPQQTLL